MGAGGAGGVFTGTAQHVLDPDPRFANIAEPPLGVFFEAAAEQSLDRRRQIRQRVPFQVFLEHTRQGDRDVVAVERAPAGEHLYSTAPNAQISARRSTGRPRACSGAM